MNVFPCFVSVFSYLFTYYFRSYRERKELPWCSITVHGFADSPVTRKLQEHGFYSNGDNLYTYVMFPQGTWSYSALGGRDVYS